VTYAVVDEGVPADVAGLLSTDERPVDVFPDEWRSLDDGRLIRQADQLGYRWLITGDRKMPYQQNLRGRSLCVLVLHSPRLPLVQAIAGSIQDVLGSPVAGHFVHLDASGCVDGKPSPHLQGD
jgi:hypothetical protein